MSQLKVNDFKLFFDSLKAFSKLANSAKLCFNETGMTIYGKNAFARGEMTTNAVTSDEPVEACIFDLSMLTKSLATVLNLYESDQSEIKLNIDLPFIKIESGKFKTKMTTCKEEILKGFISNKVSTTLTPVLEFVTSSDQIKAVNNHAYIFPDQELARIYLRPEADMENNVLYATIGNDSNALNNSLTMKLGLITSMNEAAENRNLILNFERLNLFNIVPSDSIKIQLMDKNVLVNTVRMTGKNDSYYNFVIYCSILAN